MLYSHLLYFCSTTAIVLSLAACTSAHPNQQADETKIPESHTSHTPARKHKNTVNSTSNNQPLDQKSEQKSEQESAQQNPSNPAQLQRINHQGITFNCVTFDIRDYSIEVADQPDGPGSIWSDSKSVGSSKAALAVINAGFFTPEGSPLGLVMENGVKRGALNHSSLGSGIFYSTDHAAFIRRKTHWSSISQSSPKHLLQSGPMLIENFSPVKGLSAKQSRPRSFIAHDGQSQWLIGHADSSTLAQLATALNTIRLKDFKIKTALNLDGGRSSDLWVSSSINGGPTELRGFLNKSVRNFLIIKKR